MKQKIHKEKKAAENELAKWENLANTVVEVGENSEKVDNHFIHKLLRVQGQDNLDKKTVGTMIKIFKNTQEDEDVIDLVHTILYGDSIKEAS